MYGLRGLLGVVDEGAHDGLGRQSALRVGGRAGEAAGEERQGDGGVPRVEQAVALLLGPRAVMRAICEERVVGLPVRRRDVVAQVERLQIAPRPVGQQEHKVPLLARHHAVVLRIMMHPTPPNHPPLSVCPAAPHRGSSPSGTSQREGRDTLFRRSGLPWSL